MAVSYLLSNVTWSFVNGTTVGNTVYLNAGDTINVTYTFSGTPSLALGDYILLPDGQKATLVSTTNGKYLFSYIVPSNSTPVYIHSVQLASTTIYDGAGVPVQGINYSNIPYSSPAQFYDVNNEAPTVMSVSASRANVGPAQTLTLTLNFSEPVKYNEPVRFDRFIRHAELPTLTFNNGATATLDPTKSTATTLVFDYTVGSNQNTSDLTIVSVNGLTDLSGDPVTYPLPNSGETGVQVACFMPGTLIRTPDGERAVESLAIGDLVLTAEGEAKPVLWIGRQTVSRVFADPLRVLPIRIIAGALDENLPVRDLLVSPDHALLVDGVLIQAGALVNGTTIRREEDVPTVYTYYHVELADHALLLAEGVPAETFVDAVDRMGFDNWDEHLALYPQGLAVEELPLPRAKSHRQVPMAIRGRLAGRTTVAAA